MSFILYSMLYIKKDRYIIRRAINSHVHQIEKEKNKRKELISISQNLYSTFKLLTSQQKLSFHMSTSFQQKHFHHHSYHLMSYGMKGPTSVEMWHQFMVKPKELWFFNVPKCFFWITHRHALTILIKWFLNIHCQLANKPSSVEPFKVFREPNSENVLESIKPQPLW